MSSDEPLREFLMLYALEGDCWVCVDIMAVSIVSLPPRMTHH